MTTTPTQPPDYPYCAHGADPADGDPVGCRGRRVQRQHGDSGEGLPEPYGACLAHLADADREAYLASLSPGSDVDHRCTTLDRALLDRLLDAVRDPATNKPRFGAGDFSEATFTGGAQFSDVNFDGKAEFTGAVFEGEVWFNAAHFTSGAGFRKAVFARGASFDWATVHGHALFAAVVFKGGVGCRGTSFTGTASFNWTVFEDHTAFDEAVFDGDADFGEAVFRGDARFLLMVVKGKADFRQVVFERVAQVGPLACRQKLNLAGAVFSTAVTIEAAVGHLDCRRTRWASTAALRLRHASVDLTDAVLEFPVSIAAQATPFIVTWHGRGVLNEDGLNKAPVRVLSLRGVDAAHLVLNDIDLSACRFAGTIHLDQLRLEGRCPLAALPRGWHRRGQVPVRWTQRQTLAEEVQWRIARETARAGWILVPDLHSPAPLEPTALAPVYRALRKAFEDAKNEPGAADFYYGEMEMRRNDRHTPWAERFLLRLYWAASGYGLRATRALGWLLAAMAATIVLMMGFGLPDTPAKPYPPGAGVIGRQNPQVHAAFPDRFTGARAQKAVDVVINSVVFRSSGQDLTTAGRYTEMASRFAEPVLLALALLAVRGRVKR
ncbi:pentapeptide repeat-containing protein [Streptomyces sp. 8N114]|uniref:pentapeptide repeat-containing protein n=1 Tax=Streptomyces sp. 8N114 TaxID=3457419 RepID=UPI003FD6868E